MVMMTQNSSALSSLREKIKDIDQPAKHFFTNNLCLFYHFRNNFKSLVDRVVTVLYFSILPLHLSFLFFILKSILRILEILRDENLCGWKSDDFFLEIALKSLENYCRLKEKTMEFCVSGKC